jgi:hypothetical protein
MFLAWFLTVFMSALMLLLDPLLAARAWLRHNTDYKYKDVSASLLGISTYLLNSLCMALISLSLFIS